MKANMSFKRSDLSNLDRLQKQSPAMFDRALKKGALQLLTWMNTGSPKESKKPPIKTGFLRGSSSAFVASELVGVGPRRTTEGSSEPLRSYSGKDKVVTIIYNASYAAKMHEWRGGWGEATKRDGDAGNKWIEEHLKADKGLFMEVIGKEYKKESGL